MGEVNLEEFKEVINQASVKILKDDEYKRNNGTKEQPYMIFVSRYLKEEFDLPDEPYCNERGEWCKIYVVD